MCTEHNFNEISELPPQVNTETLVTFMLKTTTVVSLQLAAEGA